MQISVQNTQNPPHLSLAKGPVNWDHFSKNLENRTNLNISLKKNDQIEKAVQNLTSIQTAIFNSSHAINIPNNSTNNNNHPPYIRELILKKRRARSCWKHYNLLSDKQIYNNLYN